MKLRGACILTHNAEKMVDFYTKVFGYSPTVDGGVDFRFYDNQLVIFKLNDDKTQPTKAIAMIYDVEDVDVEYLRLSDLGIANNPPTDKPWGVRSLMINDPDGNTVSFIKDI